MPYCSRCRTEYQLGTEKCPKCGSDLPTLTARPNPSIQTNRTAPDGRHKRFVAGLIDLLIAYGLYLAVLMIFGRRLIALRWLMLVGLPLILAIPNPYLLLKDSIEGKSVGKVIMGLVVFNEKDKRTGGVLDSIIRNWYLAIPWLGPTLFALLIGTTILAGHKKRLGDEWAKTTVINDLEYQAVR